MRLVHHEARHRQGLEQAHERGGPKPLRGDVEQLQCAAMRGVECGAARLCRQQGVQRRRPDTPLRQVVDLILISAMSGDTTIVRPGRSTAGN